jgi:prevent-host-death family protein
MEYSIADIKTHFTRVLREIEKGELAEITRHGKPVAVVMSIQAYQRLLASRSSFSRALKQLRQNDDFTPLEDELEDLRDHSPGREVDA